MIFTGRFLRRETKQGIPEFLQNIFIVAIRVVLCCVVSCVVLCPLCRSVRVSSVCVLCPLSFVLFLCFVLSLYLSTRFGCLLLSAFGHTTIYSRRHRRINRIDPHMVGDDRDVRLLEINFWAVRNCDIDFAIALLRYCGT